MVWGLQTVQHKRLLEKIYINSFIFWYQATSHFSSEISTPKWTGIDSSLGILFLLHVCMYCKTVLLQDCEKFKCVEQKLDIFAPVGVAHSLMLKGSKKCGWIRRKYHKGLNSAFRDVLKALIGKEKSTWHPTEPALEEGKRNIWTICKTPRKSVEIYLSTYWIDSIGCVLQTFFTGILIGEDTSTKGSRKLNEPKEKQLKQWSNRNSAYTKLHWNSTNSITTQTY